jgi:hypothetical protein
MMNKISFKKIGIAFLVIFLLSRSRAIIEFLSGIDLNVDGIFTLEPLRRCSAEARYVVTVIFLASCFVVIWKLVRSTRSKKKEEN